LEIFMLSNSSDIIILILIFIIIRSFIANGSNMKSNCQQKVYMKHQGL